MRKQFIPSAVRFCEGNVSGGLTLKHEVKRRWTVLVQRDAFCVAVASLLFGTLSSYPILQRLYQKLSHQTDRQIALTREMFLESNRPRLVNLHVVKMPSDQPHTVEID